VLVNYVDPDQPLCWAPQLQQEFCLTDGELGWPFSEFFWSYAPMQIPTGMILDRFARQKYLSGQRLSLVAHFGRDRFRQSREPSTSEVTTRWRWR